MKKGWDAVFEKKVSSSAAAQLILDSIEESRPRVTTSFCN
jgi:hypothetical protein